MLSALIVSAVLSMSTTARPPEYSERWLCELWAGAQCTAAKCNADKTTAQDRCKAESKKCRGASHATVSGERAKKVAECAKAMLKQKCGDPAPPECSGVSGP
jgi:hypothetical protein